MKLPQIILLSMFLALLVYTSLAMFVRPMSDDYCLLGGGIYKGPLEAVIEYYYTWSARYTAYYFGGVQGVLGNWSLIAVPILLIVSLCFAWGALVYKIASLLKLRDPRGIAVYGGLFLSLCFVDSISAEPIFWTAAMVSYGLSPLFFLLYLLSLIAVLEHQLSGIRLWLVSVIGGFALLLAAGFSETYIVFHGLILALAWLFALLFLRGQIKRTSLVFFSFGLLGLAIGAVVVLTAPGNSVRFTNTVVVDQASVGANSPSIAWNLFAYPLIDRYGTAINIFVFIATVFFLLWWYRDDTEAFLELRLERYATAKVFWLSLLLLIIINSVAIILPVLGTGWLVSRTWTMPRILQMSMAVFWAGFLTVHLVRKSTLKRLRRKILLNFTIRAIIVILILYPLVLIARNIYFGQEFASFAQEWATRDAFIREAAKTQSVVIIQVSKTSIESAMNIELPAPDYNRINECMALYYGIDRLEVSGEAAD
jgi:hypothetical protein